MTPKRILVRAPQWLGDAVVSTVFLRRLKILHPEADISVACAAGLAPLFATHPDVTSVIALPYPAATAMAAAKKLASEHFRIAYLLPRSFRTAFESWLAKIPQRIGYAGDLRSALLTKAIRYDDKLLYPHRYLKLIGEENFPLDQTKPYFPLEKPACPPELREPVLGLAPVSIAPARTWAPERFAQTANAFLKKNGGSVLLFGSAKEKEAVAAVAERITEGPVINTAGGLSLPELGWFINRCDVLLANDSGLMHVAACFEIPSVVLFGASDPTFALPPWGKFAALQHKEIFCVPCLKNHCVRFGSDRNACLNAIAVADVVAALEKLLAQ